MICIVTALDCEARPLINHFKLKRDQQFKPFPLYVGDITLAVCGVGASNAMMACAATAGLNIAAQMQNTRVNESAWLNIGIGGHSRHDIGTPFLAHKVIAHQQNINSTPKSYYPQWPGKWPCQTADVVTVVQADEHYEQAAIYDMEASGFCEAAYKFSTVELVQVLKIISDNKTSSINEKNKSMVTELVEAQMNLIVSIISRLNNVACDLESRAGMPQDYDSLITHYSVSVSMQFQLKQLLGRWQLLGDGSILEAVPVQDCRSIKDWMKAATNSLAKLPVNF